MRCKVTVNKNWMSFFYAQTPQNININFAQINTLKNTLTAITFLKKHSINVFAAAV